MASFHEPSAEYDEETEQLSDTEDTQVTIKFISKKATTEVKANKIKLIAGSGYFAHWLLDVDPYSNVVTAPKFIVPGVTIKQHSIDAAIAHLHGYNAPGANLADAVELILLARAFEIPALEIIACGHIEVQLERSSATDGLADAVRELYQAFREDPYCAIGNDVVSVVIGIAARYCGRKWDVLRSDPAFKILCSDLPPLTMDILNAVADENDSRMHGTGVNLERQGTMPPQDSPQELAE